MPYIDTDSGAFVNSDYIVAIRRDSKLQTLLVDDSRRTLYWNLTVVMADGTEHRVTGPRAADALKILNLPADTAARLEADSAPQAQVASPEDVAAAMAHAALTTSTTDDAGASELIATATELAALASDTCDPSDAEHEEWIAPAVNLRIYPPNTGRPQPSGTSDVEGDK